MSSPAAPRIQTSLSTPRVAVSPWFILLVMASGFFMILLDTTIVNVSIPSVIDSLHASLDQILWVLNAYILVYAVLLITAGRLGDMIGPRRMFMTGLILFVLSSMACGFAQSPNQLIFFRVIQGVGGAILTPQTLTMITSIFPPEKRGAAFGVWGAVAGVAAVTGPILGGFLTTDFSWRAIFYVNVPIGIAVLILAFLVVPELTVHRKHTLDIPGVLLASLGLFALVFGLIEGQRYNWGRIVNAGSFNIGSLQASLISIPTILAASIVLLAAFVIVEARTEEPLLPLSLFKDRNFSVANTVSGVVTFAMFGLFLPMTIFLQSVLGLDALHAGFVFTPMALTSTFVAPFAGRMVDRVGGKWILTLGLTLFAIGFGMVIAFASLNSQGLSFTLPLILAGIGMGCTFAPLTTLAMQNVPPASAGAASGFLNTMRQVGGAVGSSVIGAVLQYRLSIDLHSQAVRYAAQLPIRARAGFIQGFSAHGGLEVGRGQTGLTIPHNLPVGLVHQLETLGLQVFHHAFLLAMKPTLAISIAALAIGAATTLLMRDAQHDERAVPAYERPRMAVASE
ncbi:MAG TPA: DHA2 family efflux MFS transporter permease subunit [Chloroflexota bacterium]|nr:DHA2 family efflux MFS transporter permease subunit [Chloroflexota bacterium]